MSELEKHIIKTFEFSQNEFESIKTFFEPRLIKKGDFFLKEGQYVRQMAFVENGILREFLHLNGKEVTKWFSTNGYFAADLSGFIFNQKSKVNYQALVDTKILSLSKENYDKISTKISRWDKLEKLFLAKCFTVLEERVVSHLAYNSEERYNHLFSFNPQIFNLVPLNYIASMLGMTPETLSRIRNKQSNLNS